MESNTARRLECQQNAEACNHCGAMAGFEQREKPPHVGLYCRACGRWIRWIPRAQATQARPVEMAPPAPKDCNHCPELGRVIKALTGIERELTIITRAMVGANL